MSYLLDKSNDSITERICKINNIDPKQLDVSTFEVDKTIPVLEEFKEKLLSYRDKRFFIVGDYDCDGICATVIIKKLLDDLKISSNYYIPSRLKEGYGISKKIIDTAKENGFEAIITVDNGIVAYEQMDYAASLGLKTFVIDHHEYETAPVCTGFLHPNLFSEKYAEMCAAGLSCLLSNSIRKDNISMVYGGLATLADMVPVFNYNRYLLKELIRLLKEERIAPIHLLLGKNEISYQSIQFNVIPKINAVSRLDELMNVNYVVRYLLSDEKDCLQYYSKIELINSKRKELTKEESSFAEKQISNEDFILAYSKDFKEGLCGLIANKIMFQTNKPVLIFNETNGLLKGSGRGPAGFNLFEYLNGTKQLFETFGGHAQAVGLSIQLEKLKDLKDYIVAHPFTIEETSKMVLSIPQEEIRMELLNEIDSLAPYGTGFAEPLFAIEEPTIQKKFVVAGKYPKYVLGSDLSAISFNSSYLNKSFATMIGHLAKDSYHRNSISFVIEDLL